MPWPTKLTVALMVFLAIGALYGGSAILRDTSGSFLNMSSRDLAGSPFSDFLVPGLFLFVVLGIGSAAAALLLWKLPGRTSWLFAVGISLALLGWLAVQVAVIGFRFFLQPFYAAYGVAMLGLLAAARARRPQRHS